jgi:uncharacterized protein YijF (DUF1287 family)
MVRLIICLQFLFLISANAQTFSDSLGKAAMELTKQNVTFDPAYFVIDYPGGDVPADKGVCTDVIIRAYRLLGIDLQKEIHEDMKANFAKYPNNWGLSRPDKNIDHRRVPNLKTFFSRHGRVLKITNNPDDYKPGDIVCWDIGRGLKHIGIVTSLKSADGKRPLIVHNIGAGQVAEDMLFKFTITGHFRYGR